MLIVDANILVRGVLGRRVRALLETYAHQGIRFYSPEQCFVSLLLKSWLVLFR